MTRHTLIIGGGGIGSATACFLSQMAAPGERITVLERDPTFQSASSSLSASSIRQQFSTPVNIALSQWSLGFLRRLGDGKRDVFVLDSPAVLPCCRAARW
jgi:glycine/D-amino acid oxidase-like deaminating enzyme